MNLVIGEFLRFSEKKFNLSKTIVMHPIKDLSIDSYAYITYEPTSEEAIIALITKALVFEKLNDENREILDEIDEGYLFSESNFDENDLDLITKTDIKNIIIGKDIYSHPKKNNILKMVNLIEKYTNIKVSDKLNGNIEEIDEDIDTFDGSVIYSLDIENNILLGSKQFKIANKINSQEVTIIVNNKKYQKQFILDENLVGVFGISNIESDYFQKVKII